MKAITLYEPWASYIAAGLKTIETRTHARFACLVHQRIAIHAGRTFDGHAYTEATKALGPGQGFAIIGAPERRHGQVVCTAECYKVGWLTAADSKAALCDCGGRPRRFGIYLRNIRLMTSRQLVKGHQGIWEWTPPGEATDQPTPAQVAAAQRIPMVLVRPHYPPSRRQT